MENSGREVLFCDTVPVCRPVVGRYCFIIWSQCGELLQEGIVCDTEPVLRTLAGRYCFVICSQCGELLQECIVL